ncbi:hypothetical protein A5N83_01195 [Rhodococcus sp. 1139]|nr:hypothetical protein A5N83_01195 [Rhodococcus sp. 1139]
MPLQTPGQHSFLKEVLELASLRRSQRQSLVQQTVFAQENDMSEARHSLSGMKSPRNESIQMAISTSVAWCQIPS